VRIKQIDIRLVGIHLPVLESTVRATGHARWLFRVIGQAVATYRLIKRQHFGVDSAEWTGVCAGLTTDATQIVALDKTIRPALNGIERTGDDTTGVITLATNKHESRFFTQAKYAVIFLMWPVVDIATHTTNFTLVALFQIDNQVFVV